MAFTAKDVQPEVFTLGETVAARSKYLFDTNKSDGYGIGFSYTCIYWNALCVEASPRGNVFDMRITVNSTMTGYARILCVMSSNKNLIKCQSQAPVIRMTFRKNNNIWNDAIDTLSVLGSGYGKIFQYNSKIPSCNKKECEKLIGDK